MGRKSQLNPGFFLAYKGEIRVKLCENIDL